MAKLVSKVYGDALFAEAVERGEVDALYEEVLRLLAIWEENPDFSGLLGNPKIVKEEKAGIIKNIFSGRISEDLVGFLLIVVDKGRQSELPAIFRYFVDTVKEYKKIGTAYVTAAVELTDSQKDAVKTRLLETTSYEEFEMNYSTDPSLIGGMVIRIGDRVVDSSIKTQLYELKRDLLKIQLA